MTTRMSRAQPACARSFIRPARNRQARLLAGAGVLALAAGVLSASAAHAQTIKPLDIERDPNGVDLLTGGFEAPGLTLSVPGAPRLRLDDINELVPFLSGRMLPNTYGSASYDVNGQGATSDHFDCNDQGDCRSKKKNGAVLSAETFNKQFSYYEGGNGKLTFFDLQSGPQGPLTAGTDFGFYPSYIQYPDGERLSFGYDEVTTSTGLVWRRPVSVTSSLGYHMTLAYQDNTYGQAGWSVLTEASIYGAGTAPVARHTFSGNTITDLAGRQWTCVGCSTSTGAWTGPGVSLRLPGETVNMLQAEFQGHQFGSWTSKVTRDGVDWNYSYVQGPNSANPVSKVTIAAPLGFSRVVNVATSTSPSWRPRVTSVVNSLNGTTSYQYDNDVRVTKVTNPEGNAASVVYDLLGNITESRLIAKPGSGQADVVETAGYTNYGTQNFLCSQPACFKPLWTKDAKGQQTDYTWGDHGGLLTKLEPADANGQRRQTINEYAGGRVVRERVCLIASSGANLTCGTAGEQVRQITYWGNTFLPLTETATDGAGTQSLTTTYTYDDAGRVLSVDGPLAGSDDAIYNRYDIAGRKTWEVGPKGSDGYRAATRTTYRDADDKPLKVEKGVMTSPTDTTLTVLGEQRHQYDVRRNLERTTVAAGGADQGLTQLSYDARNRSECSTVRMNPAAWSGLPASACTLGTEGSAGADRITKTTHDAESRVLTIQKGVGTTLQQDYVTYTYSANGKQLTVRDANGNLAGMTFDGHDRQTRWNFPSKTSPGQVSSSDYEQYGYDPNGNRTSLRKRDGSTLTFQYDALNRMNVKVVPERADLSGTLTRDVYYDYDVGNRQTYARFDSPTGEGVTNGYDSLGRLSSSSLAMDGATRTLNYTLDAAGRRVQLSWMDGAATSFAYDAAGGMLGIYEGGLGSTNALWTYSSADYGRRVRKTTRNGQFSEGQADGMGRLASLTTDLPGSEQDNVTSFAYNPASQIGSRAISNNAYAWTGHTNVDQPYAVNGLNQYTNVGSAALSYDPNGNLTGTGSSNYAFDIENRLVSTSGAMSAQLRYDPVGRLYETSGGAGITRFLYDGDELVAEHDGSGALLRRYVHGAAIDDPMVWYEGAGLGDARWLMSDHQGSVVNVSQAIQSLRLNSYDEYGDPAAGNMGRFQYTGQVWIPELSIYYYKARIYAAALGRFLQTDPVGYKDQVNLYAYVNSDPVNGRDPSGECQSCQDDESKFERSLDGKNADEMRAAVLDRSISQGMAIATVMSAAVPVSRVLGAIGRLVGLGEKAVLSGKVANQAFTAARMQAGFQSANAFGKVIGWGGGGSQAAATKAALARIGQIDRSAVAAMREQGLTKQVATAAREVYRAAVKEGTGGTTAPARLRLLDRILKKW